MLGRRLVLASLVCLVAPATADDSQPCVFRLSTIRRPIHTVTLDDKALAFCTGLDCWALDLARRTFTTIPPPTSPPEDPEDLRRTGQLEHDRGRATATSATFCPRGKGSCRTFRYRFRHELVVDPYIAINAEGTLGTVTLKWNVEDPQRGFPLVALTMIFDLVQGTESGRFRGGVSYPITILGTTIIADDQFYTPRGVRLGGERPAESETTPILLGPSAIAYVDRAAGHLVIHDLAANKTRHAIELGIRATPGRIEALIASRDGRQIYAIAGWPREGEVLTVDAVDGKLFDRRAPPECVPSRR